MGERWSREDPERRQAGYQPQQGSLKNRGSPPGVWAPSCGLHPSGLHRGGLAQDGPSLTTILGSADPRLCTQPQAPCRNVNLASARVALGAAGWLGEEGGSLLLRAEAVIPSDASKFPVPLGSDSLSEMLRAITCSLPSGFCPHQRPPGINHLNSLMGQTGALRVLRFLIQWWQTFISPQKHSMTPRDPLSHCHFREPLCWGLSIPALSPAPHRTSLAEGKRVGK